MLETPATDALRDPPESDSEGRVGERPEKASGIYPKHVPSSPEVLKFK